MSEMSTSTAQSSPPPRRTATTAHVGKPPGRSLARRAFYTFARAVTSGIVRVLYRRECRTADRVPRSGALLIVANHQSHLDAPVIGTCVPRTDVVFLARQGLFTFKPLGWLISSLNAVPINEKQGDLAAIRVALGALGQGRALIMFPEGSRTMDGAMRPFKRGAWLLLSRAGECPVLPVAIEGAYDAWPRGKGFPGLFRRRIAVAFGEPIAPESLRAMGADGALVHLARVIDTMRLELREEMRRETRGRYPRPGLGDRAMALGAAGDVGPRQGAGGAASRE